MANQFFINIFIRRGACKGRLLQNNHHKAVISRLPCVSMFQNQASLSLMSLDDEISRIGFGLLYPAYQNKMSTKLYLILSELRIDSLLC